jgi:hypothetical protein
MRKSLLAKEAFLAAAWHIILSSYVSRLRGIVKDLRRATRVHPRFTLLRAPLLSFAKGKSAAVSDLFFVREYVPTNNIPNEVNVCFINVNEV